MVKQGLAPTREKARALIMGGNVRVSGERILKAGTLIPKDAPIEIASPLRYVSRGGIKLEAALRHFNIDIEGKNFLDVGASTGGFTDCLLQHGAARVICVDVGYGQLHPKLRNDPRVLVLERTNARYLKPEDLPIVPDGATVDVSFISLCILARPLTEILPPGSPLIALVKPQFEVGRSLVGKGGVVRDDSLRLQALEKVKLSFAQLGWATLGTLPSPIKGPKGNLEYLLYLVR